MEVAVPFGAKYSAVNRVVVPASEVRVNLCPFIEPRPSGKINESPLTNCLVRGPLIYDIVLPPAGNTAEDEVLRSTSLPEEEVVITPFVSNNWLPTSARLPSLTVRPAGLSISMFQNLLLPLKSPVMPWAAEPLNETVAAG